MVSSSLFLQAIDSEFMRHTAGHVVWRSLFRASDIFCTTALAWQPSTDSVEFPTFGIILGDTISVVFGKATPGQKNCGFVFRFTSPTNTSSTSTEDEDDELEETQTLDQDALLSSLEKSTEKDDGAATTSVGGAAKRPRDDVDSSESSNKRLNSAPVIAPPPPPQDDMEENMMCCICQDILHDCISVQPCMHCFCGGCYSGWMKQSKLCPQCRKSVQHVAKNHTVNNLVNAYLKMHPDKRREKEDLDELDKKNVIREGLKDGKSKSVNQLRSVFLWIGACLFY